MSNKDNSPDRIGLDIGGANLKVADSSGNSLSQFFPLWQQRDQLPTAIKKLLSDFNSTSNRFALTMTGELADCYQTKQEGVSHIVDSTVVATNHANLWVATVDDRWLRPEEAKESTDLVAAANWRLSARYVAKHLADRKDRVLLIDIGSTTTDLIPIQAGKVIAKGSTDTERLIESELVYCGTRRTSIDSLTDKLPYRGSACPIMREKFATIADAWLLLGYLDEEQSCTETADGKPFTRDHSIDRLARLVGADRNTFQQEDAMLVAQEVAKKQIELISGSIKSHDYWPFDTYYLSGEGEFLGQLVVENMKRDLDCIRASESIGFKASSCGPAYCAAWLASQEISNDNS